MARRTAKRSAEAGESHFKWKSNEWTYLLAYIDHCRVQDGSRRRRKFDDAIRLEMIRKFGRPFNSERIDRKIQWIVSQRASKTTNPEDVRDYGSKYVDFDLFWPREMREFELAQEELGFPRIRADFDENPQTAGKSINDDSATIEKCETLVQLSKFQSRASIVETRLNSKSLAAPVDDQMDRCDSRTLEPEEGTEKRHENRRSLQADICSMSLDMEVSKRQISEPASDAIDYFLSRDCQSPEMDIQYQDVVSGESRRTFLQDKLEVPNSTGVSSFQSNPGETSGMSTMIEEVRATRKFIANFFSTVETLLNHPRNEETQTDQLIQKLPSIFRQLTGHSNDLKNFLLSYESASKTSGSDIGYIFSLEEQIRILVEQRNSWWKLDNQKPPPAITKQEIGNGMIDIYDCIKSVFQPGLPSYSPADSWKAAGDLKGCLQTLGLNAAGGGVYRGRKIRSLLRTIQSHNFLRALLAAAACNWVFDSEFPDFNEDTNPILDGYRQRLFKQQGGPPFLRNLDFDTHDTLLQERWWNIQVSRQAIILGSKFEALLKQLKLETHLIWQKLEVESERFREKVLAVFRKTLELKAKTILTEFTYGLRFISRGANFDRDGMIGETKYGANFRDEDLNLVDSPLEIEICLFPALFAYTGEPVPKQPDDVRDIAEVLVRRRNFRLTTGASIEDDAGYMVEKAVAICKGEI